MNRPKITPGPGLMEGKGAEFSARSSVEHQVSKIFYFGKVPGIVILVPSVWLRASVHRAGFRR